MGLFKSKAQTARDNRSLENWHLARAWFPVIVHQGGVVWPTKLYVRALNTAYLVPAFERKRLDEHSLTLIGLRYRQANRYHEGLEEFPCEDRSRPPAPTPTRTSVNAA